MARNIYAIRVNIAAAFHQLLNSFQQGSLHCLVGPTFCRLFISGRFIGGSETGWQLGSKHITGILRLGSSSSKTVRIFAIQLSDVVLAYVICAVEVKY